MIRYIPPPAARERKEGTVMDRTAHEERQKELIRIMNEQDYGVHMTMQEWNLTKLMDVLSDVELTPEEEKTFRWLSGNDISTIDNICSVIRKKGEAANK
jgi:hypothetical protein